MKHQLTCPYCGAPVIFAPASAVYGRNLHTKGEHLYLCSRWPACDAYVHAHRHDGRPMGTPANARLRRKRIAAHNALAGLCRQKHMSKWAAYVWLQCKLGLDAGEAHIGAFSDAMCDKVIELCRRATEDAEDANNPIRKGSEHEKQERTEIDAGAAGTGGSQPFRCHMGDPREHYRQRAHSRHGLG